MNLFDYGREKFMMSQAPLALRMRPRTLEEFVGQQDIVGPGRMLRRAIEADQLSSLIFYGPPGCGKTALAQVIAKTSAARFIQVNAVTAGVKELRQIIDEAREQLGMYQRKTIVFIDEIHRFNKAQQDALLPSVEEGIIILIGATTENPYFEVNKALLSRSRVFEFKPLKDEEIALLLRRAMEDKKRGLGSYRFEVDPDAFKHLVHMAAGDARIALNALELAVLTTPPGDDGVRRITLQVAEDCIQKRAVRYDRAGDEHYDVVSAFIKSLRGSDPDAAVHWLARMIYAGEDPRFIARRMIILAAEDIGLADPMALVVANAAAQAVEYVGMPEARLPLTEAALYLACAPKSNAVIKAIDRALDDLAKKPVGEVPVHLRDAHYKGAAELGRGRGYKYPHDYPGNYVEQQYLPDELKGVTYYHPSSNGREAEYRERLMYKKEEKHKKLNKT
ncbi:AAA family ATPase [Calderihabitans maritimus]|uniref:Replication-associated recombination protein A n=1 Tax=Calderihabitans maritimus TaxID=1246530 RepID=A0A1Z5HT31_9FIRM|nr:AAA family ATPase [Calderihabitans maritimus]GAW92689.1 ATPase AAA [Calderihabitans maritimus]